MNMLKTFFARGAAIVLLVTAVEASDYVCYERKTDEGCIYTYLNPLTGTWDEATADNGDVMGTGPGLRLNAENGWTPVV